ncbi:helix-turn-helix domain-containing protein [Saccharopolyspora endophytica]|uniref:Helix-turn-helix domain-containing protein n=2 Tax=Saccharopolyspora TaxID=1835 RepID=A0ABS5DLM7_9PSEU|nr:helix-turn-helix domain-containing protein [Saccharopolyspora endophytica]MBQ0927182.1 helix-turn-helix domain-containing protein [Saccharopolyspora endophytica]
MEGTEQRTVLPPARADELLGLLRALDEQRSAPALIARDGTRIDLPDELYDVLHDVVLALSRGMAITVAPRHTVLTTGEAAEMLGISRPTLVRLLEAGEIPYEQPGRHRRIRLDDLLAYQERARRARAAGLDEMVRVSEAGGVYDVPPDAKAERRSVPEEEA